MVNITLEDLYMEIRSLSKKVDVLTSLMESSGVKKSESTSAVTVSTDRESVIEELSKMKFFRWNEAYGILKSYGFESNAGGDWFIHNKLHLSCQLKLEHSTYDKWKVVFS